MVGRAQIAALAAGLLLGPALWLAASGAVAPPAHGQPPPPPTPPTPAPGTASPAPTAAPPSLAGTWSVTRSWYRGCPGCGGTILRTVTWEISQSGAEIRVARGPSGLLRPDGAGGGWLDLEGLESGAEGTLRFLYGSLRVAPDGRSFDGGFGGSERIQNPCGSTPPLVTCFASAGFLHAQRVAPPGTPGTPGGGASPTVRPGASATGPTPTGPTPTGPTPTGAPPTLAPPTAAASETPGASPSPAPSPTFSTTGTPIPRPTAAPTSSAAPPPLVRRYLPLAWRETAP